MTAVTALRGRIVTPETEILDGVVVVEGDRIDWVGPADQHSGPTDQVGVILPGLVDLHCHGGGGASFTSGEPDQVSQAAAEHLSRGTTTLVGSTVADAPDRLLAVVSTLAAACDRRELAAIHLEGPFLASSRCGAQDPRSLLDPDPALMAELLAAGRGHVRLVTIAPELPGAVALAEQLRAQGVVPAVGHTDADTGVVADFLGTAGAGGHVTHLFNGMPALHHRAPGPAGAALGSSATLELIADGAHLADETVAWVMALAADRVCFVSDAMAAAGMPDGDYVLGPQRVVVRDRVARLADGDSIAGGTARLGDVVARQVAAGLPLTSVLRAAAQTPAAVLGLSDRGGVVAGLRADLVVADDRLAPVRVMRAGEWVS